jgi:hypothetical protein
VVVILAPIVAEILFCTVAIAKEQKRLQRIAGLAPKKYLSNVQKIKTLNKSQISHKLVYF